ncbi:MAG TPA: NAD-dependent epimerase/dehydratase family protein [Myxococcales bacterium]|nr:NAD-dependent epimerase/dehydratase family protein [Myxococcales bacterium]
MRTLVTGAAGFIGSNLVDQLLLGGHEVVGVDNLSTGSRRFLERALEFRTFQLVERDLTDPSALDGLLSERTDHVFHLSANADVRDGLKHPRRDLEQNTLVTWNVLDAMRRAGAKAVTFSSTGSVYGEAPVIPTPETCPFPLQTSLYGASKLAGEALISAYCEGYGFRANIFRFVSILGERYSHGHIYDFVRALRKDPTRLRVLGDGKQRKSYVYVGDCVRALLHAAALPWDKPARIFNLGTAEYVDVDRSLGFICDELGVSPQRLYTGGDRGWVGDNPFIFLDTQKLQATGWKPELTIEEGVRRTVRFLVKNEWLFTEREQKEQKEQKEARS